MLRNLVIGLLLSVSLVGCKPVIAPTEAVSSELETVCSQVESILEENETYAVSTDSKKIIITGFDNLEEMYSEVDEIIKDNEEYTSVAISTDMSQVIIVNNK